MFDAKCLELAEHFLPSNASVQSKDALAQAIQDEVERWVGDNHVKARVNGRRRN